MNIIQSIRKSFGNITKALGNSIYNPGFMSWFNPKTWTKRGLLLQYKRYVYAIVATISESAAKVNLEVYRHLDKGDTPIPNHEILQLLKKPNPDNSQFQFLEMHFTFMELMGESFWYIAKGSRTGTPRELYLLRPDLMNVVIDEKDPRGLVSGYALIKSDGTKVPFDKDEILHFKLPNPINPYRGMGVVEASQDYIQTEEYATDWTKNSIYNAGRPSGIVGIKGTIDADQWDKIKRSFKQEFSGTKNTGKTMLLKEIDGISYQKLGMELDGVALKDLKALTRDDIMVMWRVSKTLLGITEDVNYASSKEARAVFADNVIAPKLDRFVDHFNAFYVEPRYGESIYLTYEDLVSMSDKDRLDQWTQGWNKWLTTNDVRKERGDEPIDGGDVIYLSAALVPVMGNVPELPEPPTPSEEEPEEEPPAPEEEPEEEEEEEEKSVEKKSYIGKGQAEIFRQLLYRSAEPWIKEYIEKLQKGLDEQMNQILEANKGKAAAARARNKDIDGWLPNASEFIKKMKEVLIPFIYELMIAQSKIGFELIGDEDLDIDEISITPNVTDYVRIRTERMLDRLSNTIVDDLSQSLQQGFLDGDSIAELRKRVESVYKDIATPRAELIARTETIATSNHAALESYRQSGVVVSQKWFANPGACEYCAALDGKTVGLYESFALLGQSIPGDKDHFYEIDYTDIEHPPLHPNCECSILPVVE